MSDDAARAQLQGQLPASLNVNVDEAFPQLSGFGIKKLNERRVEWFKLAEPVLNKALEDDEVVRHLTLGIVNYTWEMMMGGAYTQLLNRTLIVVTTKRVLMIHCNSKGKPSSFVNDVPLESIKAMKGGFLGSLSLKTGKATRSFSGIPKDTRKAAQSFFAANPNASGGFRHLCPSCFTAHETRNDACSRCGAAFKSPKTAALRSLAFPGLGDWYIGHKLFAAMEMFGSIITWVIVFALISEGQFLFGLFLLVLVNGMDAILTYHQAKKGLMSADGQLPSSSGNLSTAQLGEAPPPIA